MTSFIAIRVSPATRAATIFAALVLAGCAGAPPEPPPPPPAPKVDRVAIVRNGAEASTESVELIPLQNPAVEYLRAQATRLETQGKFPAAAQKIDQALGIEPGNPQLMQLKAEALLRAEKYLDAEKMAMKSYETGQHIGRWCTRNWLVIAESRAAQGDTTTSDSARKRAAGCPVGPLIKY